MKQSCCNLLVESSQDRHEEKRKSMITKVLMELFREAFNGLSTPTKESNSCGCQLVGWYRIALLLCHLKSFSFFAICSVQLDSL